MIAIYVRKIKSGSLLWTKVPSLWKEKVVAALEAEGYVCNEDGTVTLPEPETVEA